MRSEFGIFRGGAGELGCLTWMETTAKLQKINSDHALFRQKFGANVFNYYSGDITVTDFISEAD